MKTKKLSTTPYHPETNGLTERFNKTICQILSTYSDEHQSNWDEYINASLFEYRTSHHETTNKTPFELLYGRDARLPTEADKHADFQIKNFDKIWIETKIKIEGVNNKRKARHDSKYNHVSYKANDLVRLHSPATKQGLTHKLRQDKWIGPFKILRVIYDVNVELQLDKGKTKIVHVNRVKLAEESRASFSDAKPTRKAKPKGILKKEYNRRIKKHVRFENDVIESAERRYNFQPRKNI